MYGKIPSCVIYLKKGGERKHGNGFSPRGILANRSAKQKMKSVRRSYIEFRGISPFIEASASIPATDTAA